MNPAKPDELATFQGWSVTFLTFIYAAALDIVLTHYLLKSSHSLWGILALMVFVILLASDWSSKARARIVLHGSSKYKSHSLNSIWVFGAELVMVFSLIIGSSYLLQHYFEFPHDVSESKGLIIVYIASSVFACLSHFWDIILIRAAKIPWTNAVSAFLAGTLETQEWYAKYLPRLVYDRDKGIAKLAQLRDNANNDLSTILGNWSKHPTKFSDFFRWLRIYSRFIFLFLIHNILFQLYRALAGWIHGLYSAASYFVAFHVLVSNLMFSIIIFHHFLSVQNVSGWWMTFFRSSSDGSVYIEHPFVVGVIVLILLITLPTAHRLLKKKSAVVLFTSICWVVFVFTLPALFVIIVLVAQQVMVTMFFHRFSIPSRLDNLNPRPKSSYAFE